MEGDDEVKTCVGCGKRFTINDVPPEGLRIKKFKYFKRCNDCRKRTDIRKANYWDEYTQKKNISKTETFSFIEQLVIDIGVLITEDILPYEQELELERKYVANDIDDNELTSLGKHLQAIVFFLHCKLKPPSYPIRTLEELDLKFIAAIIYSERMTSLLQEE